MMLRAVLFDVAAGWAAQAHRLYHDVHPAMCSFSVADATHGFWNHESERRGKVLFVRWARRFWPAFISAHPPSAATRLARLLNDEYRSGANVICLARLIGCQHAMLRRQFPNEFGMSIIEYRNSVRVEHALHHFAAGDPAKMVADKTGWNSRKNLYRALHRYAEVRRSAITPATLTALIGDIRWRREGAAWIARKTVAAATKRGQ